LERKGAGVFKLEKDGYLLHLCNGESLVTDQVDRENFDLSHPFFQERFNGSLVN
jgi:hypothetical protein